jgi:hypothetical protein
VGIGDGDKRSGDLAEGKAHTVRGGSDLCESLIFGAAAQGHEDTDRNINASTGQEIWVQRRMHPGRAPPLDRRGGSPFGPFGLSLYPRKRINGNGFQ